MKPGTRIDVHHVTRIEGHANIRVEGGRLKEARWEVVETPRFFEAILRGKDYAEAPWITSRICGICSVGHTLASLLAIENAFCVEPGVETVLLRKLLKHMETLQSHVLHMYFLSAPDYLGTESVIPLIKSHPEVVSRALALKKTANDAVTIIGGRRMHPTTPVVGGFTRYPEKKELASVAEKLHGAFLLLDETVELFRTFDFPRFRRQTEYVSLCGADEYPFFGDVVCSTDGVKKSVLKYKELTNEYTSKHSTAKWCRLSRDSFAVGPLARFNNNAGLLGKRAKAAAEALGLSPVCHNPFMANAARLVECHEALENSISTIEKLLACEMKNSPMEVQPRSSRGVAAVEVPRGILYHCYEFNSQGEITHADCVIPTGQNHANIEADLRALVTGCAAEAMSDEEIQKRAQMLVRAYDPCVSCSVH